MAYELYEVCKRYTASRYTASRVSLHTNCRQDSLTDLKKESYQKRRTCRYY